MSGAGDPQDVFDSSAAVSSLGVSSSSASSSTVRPRVPRLASFVEEENEDGMDGGAAAEGSMAYHSALGATSTAGAGSGRSQFLDVTSSPYSSGTSSPNARRHLARGSSHDTLSSRSKFGSGRADMNPGGKSSSSGFATDLLGSSWSSLQGFASAVMGSGTSEGDDKGSTNGYPWRQPSGSGSFGGTAGKRPALPSSWGPSRQDKPIVPGTKEERLAFVQAKKRERLLQANGDTTTPDSQGNHKRKTSMDDSYQSSVPPASQDESDALVYIHQVQPNDSLTGVSIRYGCPLAVLRKSNGFWPSDSIQSRKMVVLPAASCTLKGRPITHDSEPDLLGGISSSSLEAPMDGSSNSFGPSLQAGYGSTASSVSGKVSKDAPQWTHESWVQVDGFSSPVELGRMRRAALGFFPRARRKSQVQSEPYCDLDSLSNSRSSEPHPSSPPRDDRFARLSSASPSPSRFRDRSTSSSNLSPSSYRRHRSRRSLVLSGPGGVGTLDRRAVGPGPGPDSLNTFITAHLPHLAINPATREQHQPTSSHLAHQHDRVSMDSTSSIPSNSSSAGLENIGGAIEGWFRKAATRAKSGLNELQRPPSHHTYLGISGRGDLIELGDTSESGSRSASTVRQGITDRQYNEQNRSSRRADVSASSTSEPQRSMRGRATNNRHETDRLKGD